MNIHPALVQELHRLREHEIAAAAVHTHRVEATAAAAGGSSRRRRFVRPAVGTRVRIEIAATAGVDLDDPGCCSC